MEAVLRDMRAALAKKEPALVEIEAINKQEAEYFAQMLDSGAPVKDLFPRLLATADGMMDRIKEHTPCGSGCSHCCNMAVKITDLEAGWIQHHIGKGPVKRVGPTVPIYSDLLDDPAVEQYKGVPCPFLEAGKCSIYDVRPLTCRIYHSVWDSPDPCDLSKGNHDIPSMDLGVLAMFLVVLCMRHNPGMHTGDIRSYFPKGFDNTPQT